MEFYQRNVYNLNMYQKNYLRKLVFLMALFVCFGFFLYISRYAPVAGDDWGYAIGGRNANAFVKAIQNYFTWSGRFLSELWGFLIAPRKQVWNILNPCIFTVILCFLIKNTEVRRITWKCVLGFYLMISVNNSLRMQTYTWIMGTTYVIPLMLFLVHVYFLRCYWKGTLTKWMKVIWIIVVCLLPLYMENASVLLFVSNLLALWYAYYTKNPSKRFLYLLLVLSVIGICLIRFSPGALYRMSRDHEAFNQLSLFEKIATNWVYMIRWTYTEHSVLVRLLCIVGIFYLWQKKKNSLFTYLATLVFVGTFLHSYTWLLYEWTHMNLFYILGDLSVPHSLTLHSIIYILFTIALFYVASLSTYKWYLWFLLICAGSANGVMLISPIFDARSSIYTVYCFFLFLLALFDDFDFPKRPYIVCILVCCIGIVYYGLSYQQLYHTIHLVDVKRQSQIEYYRVRPDTKEAYILGYPDQSVHSADVLPGDTYHDETFKEYYYLNPEMEIKFYYLEEYTDEEIQS